MLEVRVINQNKLVKKAVIPVAGLGTRMLPATKAIPKELLPVYDRPIIEHVVREAVSGGIEEIIFITRSGKEAIENHFDKNYELEHRLEKKGQESVLSSVQNILPDFVKILSIRQGDALGLGHAVLCAKDLIGNEPFAVLLPDVLVIDNNIRTENFSFQKLIESWEESGKGQVMLEQVDPALVDRYGIVDFFDQVPDLFTGGHLNLMVEKPSLKSAPSNYAVIGRYILPAEIFEILETTEAGIGGEIQLTDALDELLRKEGLYGLITDAETYDCGNKIGFLEANIALGLRDVMAKKSIVKLYEKIISREEFKDIKGNF